MAVYRMKDKIEINNLLRQFKLLKCETQVENKI